MTLEGSEDFLSLVRERLEAGTCAYVTVQRLDGAAIESPRLDLTSAGLQAAGLLPKDVEPEAVDVEVLIEAAQTWLERTLAVLGHGEGARAYVAGPKGTDRQSRTITANEDIRGALDHALAEAQTPPEGLPLDMTVAPEVQMRALEIQALNQREAALNARMLAFVDLILRERATAATVPNLYRAAAEDARKMVQESGAQIRDLTTALTDALAAQSELRIDAAERAEEAAEKRADREQRGDIIEQTVDRGVGLVERLALLKFGVPEEVLNDPDAQELLMSPKLHALIKDKSKLAAVRDMLEAM